MNDKIHLKLLLVPALVITQSLLAETEISISSGSYNYDVTTSEQATGDEIELSDSYLSARVESGVGIFALDKTIGASEDKNFDRFNYKSSPLMYRMGDPLSLIYLPTIDLKSYSEPNRDFSENTISTWLGIFSYSAKEDQVNSVDVKSTRYGLTTSKLAEELKSFVEYGYKNPDMAEAYAEKVRENNPQYSRPKLDENGCHTTFYYVGGSRFCERDSMVYYLYYGLSYDYYAIDVDHQELGSGSGNGFTYGIIAVGMARYEIFNNNFIGIGGDISYFTGSESIDFSEQQSVTDDISRQNFNVTLEYTARF